jgi:hypothetical protein
MAVTLDVTIGPGATGIGKPWWLSAERGAPAESLHRQIATIARCAAPAPNDATTTLLDPPTVHGYDDVLLHPHTAATEPTADVAAAAVASSSRLLVDVGVRATPLAVDVIAAAHIRHFVLFGLRPALHDAQVAAAVRSVALVRCGLDEAAFVTILDTLYPAMILDDGGTDGPATVARHRRLPHLDALDFGHNELLGGASARRVVTVLASVAVTDDAGASDATVAAQQRVGTLRLLRLSGWSLGRTGVAAVRELTRPRGVVVDVRGGCGGGEGSLALSASISRRPSSLLQSGHTGLGGSTTSTAAERFFLKPALVNVLSLDCPDQVSAGEWYGVLGMHRQALHRVDVDRHATRALATPLDASLATPFRRSLHLAARFDAGERRGYIEFTAAMRTSNQAAAIAALMDSADAAFGTTLALTGSTVSPQSLAMFAASDDVAAAPVPAAHSGDDAATLFGDTAGGGTSLPALHAQTSVPLFTCASFVVELDLSNSPFLGDRGVATLFSPEPAVAEDKRMPRVPASRLVGLRLIRRLRLRRCALSVGAVDALHRAASWEKPVTDGRPWLWRLVELDLGENASRELQVRSFAAEAIRLLGPCLAQSGRGVLHVDGCGAVTAHSGPPIPPPQPPGSSHPSLAMVLQRRDSNGNGNGDSSDHTALRTLPVGAAPSTTVNNAVAEALAGVLWNWHAGNAFCRMNTMHARAY